MEPNFKSGTVFHMDNLDALRGMNSETVDLIATDPPFNTGRNREAVGGKYVDQWRWGDNVHPIWLDQIRDDNRALVEVIESAMHAHDKNLGAFLCFLGVRLLEMRRVLKPTGSIYLHCNPTASHYIKAAMDAVFGKKNFRNEIAWCYRGGGVPKNGFGRKHDLIFRYSKTNSVIFNVDPVRIPYSPDSKDRLTYKARSFRKNKTYDNYQQNPKGKHPEDWWEIQPIMPSSKERTGYPDQKPVKLYERIILASSNPGDLVLDPFCGCGTTIMAARKHKRQWIGIDRSDDARAMILCNLAGMKKNQIEELRAKGEQLSPGWFDERLAKYETHFIGELPVRTDEGDEAAPKLKHIFSVKERSIFTHDEMRQILFKEFGPYCWGCDFKAPEGERGVRYLELDHINPKSGGGSDHLDNRALLCGPCNKDKSDNLALPGLRRKTKVKVKEHPIDLAVVGQWCRDYLEDARAKRPINTQLHLDLRR